MEGLTNVGRTNISKMLGLKAYVTTTGASHFLDETLLGYPIKCQALSQAHLVLQPFFNILIFPL